MESRGTGRRSRWPLMAILVLLCGYLALETVPGLRQLLPIWDGATDEPLSGLASSQRITIARDTQVSMVTHYLRCGHDESDELTGPPSPMVGLDIDGIRRVYPEWRVKQFTEDRVILDRDSDAMCQDDQKYRYVTIREGRVVVLHGSGRSPSSPLLRATEISATMLSKADREMLEAGIVLNSDQEVSDWLEGLSE